MKCQNPGAYCTRDALPAAGSPQCAECREVYAGSRVHHVTTSAWHRQWSERDWRVRTEL